MIGNSNNEQIIIIEIKKMKSTVILSSNLPCEIGASALYNCLDEDSAVIQMTIQNSKDYDLTCNEITNINESPTQIIMIGTYWEQHLAKLISKFEKTQIILYYFSDLVDSDMFHQILNNSVEQMG